MGRIAPIERLTVLVVALAAAPAGGQGDAPPPATHLRCGSFCLYTTLVGLELYDGPYKDLETELGQPGAAGYSIEQLAAVAEKHGAHTKAVRATPESLPHHRRPFACIALIDGSHFVVVDDLADGRVEVIDPPEHYTVPEITFASRWDGRALLIADRPIEAISPPWWRGLLWPLAALLAVATLVPVARRLWLRYRN